MFSAESVICLAPRLPAAGKLARQNRGVHWAARGKMAG